MSADPAGLLLPVPEQEEDLTRQWLDRRFSQVRPARPGSAVVLVRDGDDGPEVFLRHRAGRTPLGRVGLPGGALLESDADSCPWYGPEPSQWAHTFGTTDRRRARQHVVAAVRQLHDEAGVLLAGRSDTDVVSTARIETWGGGHSSLEEGSESLPHLLAARGLGVRADLLRPVMRWRSAPHVHRRFDTAVFATTTPPVQSTPTSEEPGPELQAWVPACRALAGPLRLPGPAGAEGMAPFDQVATPLTQVIVRRVAAHRTAAAFLLSATPCARRGPVPEYHLVTEAGDDGIPRMRVERAPRD